MEVPQWVVDADSTPRVGPGCAEPVNAAPHHAVVPSGTPLALELESTLASDISRVNDLIRAHVVGGHTVIPEGSLVQGSVIAVEASGKVQGRAQLAFRFDINDTTYDIWTTATRYEAEGTKTEDAKKIGIGVAAGALIGGPPAGRRVR